MSSLPFNLRRFLVRATVGLLLLALFNQSLPSVMAEQKICNSNPKVKYPPGLVFFVRDMNSADINPIKPNNELVCNENLTVRKSEFKNLEVYVFANPEKVKTYQFQKLWIDSKDNWTWFNNQPNKTDYNVSANNEKALLDRYQPSSERDWGVGEQFVIRVYDITGKEARVEKGQGFPTYNDGSYAMLHSIKIVADTAGTSLKDQLAAKNSSKTSSSSSVDFSNYLPDQRVDVFANPLESETVGGLIVRIVQMLLILAGLSATAVIAISGFQLVLSAGAPEKRASAIKAITGAIIGLIVAVLSFSIVAILKRIIS